MLRVFLLFIVTLNMQCASREIRDPRKAHLHLTIGTDHLNNGHYPQALAELTTALSYNPDNAVIRNNLGIAYFVRQKYSEAEKHLRKAIELEPNYTEARNNLGRTLIEMNLIPEAIRLLKTSDRDLKYANPEKTKSNLGIAYFKIGNFKVAKEYLSESLKIRSQHCQTSNYFARTLFELALFEPAAIAFDQAANNCKDENFDEPTYYGGLSYFKLNKRSMALARFEEVVSNFPNGQYMEDSAKMIKLLKK